MNYPVCIPRLIRNLQSKQLFGVFSNAKNAYRERKAHFQSERNAKLAEKEALKAMQDFSFDDTHSVASSRRSGRSHRSHGGGSRHQHRRISHYEHDGQRSAASSQDDAPMPVSRRHTHHDVGTREPPARPVAHRSKTDTPVDVDMDLAYGDFHPSSGPGPVAAPKPLPAPPAQTPNNQQLQKIEDPELNGLVGKAQWLLEEAECLHHSATTTIAHLEQHPDAMAAVALTLAEISNLVAKMAPAALSMLKSSAPAVFGLLASPQFLIAAGVGLGATIVMFGGYRIIKQIQGSTGNNNANNANGNNNNNAPARKELEEPDKMDEMMEINTDCLSNVELWRRGVADAEYNSKGMRVDGEFISPTAAARSGIDVTTARMSRDPRFKFDDDAATTTTSSSRRSHRSKSTRGSSKPPTSFKGWSSKTPRRARSTSPSSRAPSKPPTRSFSKAPAPSRSYSKRESKHESKHSERDSGQKEKPKRSSKLRLMFTP